MPTIKRENDDNDRHWSILFTNRYLNICINYNIDSELLSEPVFTLKMYPNQYKNYGVVLIVILIFFTNS